MLRPGSLIYIIITRESPVGCRRLQAPAGVPTRSFLGFLLAIKAVGEMFIAALAMQWVKGAD
jgi:hypothetical protein